MKEILVIGSLNMDLVTYVPHLPQAGETISSRKFVSNPGGKGANQAVAAARLGAHVRMIGKVGNDAYGDQLIESLQQAGVLVDSVIRDDVTGMAFISVSDQGENQIVLVPGANHYFHQHDMEKIRTHMETCDLIVMQLEIPFDVVENVIQMAAELGKAVIFNPAPAQQLPTYLLQHIHTLVVNETELAIIADAPVTTEQEIDEAAQRLQSRGVKRMVVTLGEKGSLIINQNGQTKIPPFQVTAVDTTGAGDAYLAGFIVGISEGLSDQKAAQFASKVAALTVTREGAQQALPTREEVNQWQ